MNWDGNIDITDHELHAQVTDLARRLDALEADNTATKAALRKLGAHADGCSFHPGIPQQWATDKPKAAVPCDCWLSREEEQ